MASVKEVESLMSSDQKNIEMRRLIESPLVDGDKKTKIDNFLKESSNQQIQNDENDHPSARKVEIQLDDCRMRILEFLHYMKENREKKSK